jgi:hypothetical protein
MKFKHDAMSRRNHGSGHSGKQWLYASGVLAMLVGGAVLETEGVTPRILNYLQEDLGDPIAHAISNTSQVLSRGSVLPTDFYAAVDNFTVPKTIGQDIRNNATSANIGPISPYWQGATYTIPSAPNSNAVVNFNQPLDPNEDFSISGSVTVPDARIAAAGFYISDVPPSEIIGKLGVGNDNGPGSSGALKNEISAYRGHYMLFAGFHNTGGYAAILASGTAYSRINSNGLATGNSKYMDGDYVGFGGNRNDVKVEVTIDYVAATGIATVTYKHDSATTDGGVGQYNRKTKSATVQFYINKNAPVYLGIVGNGDQTDPNGDYTSRSTINTITGSYLTTNRTLQFRDEAGHILAPLSKVLLPRGARLGIGNGDTTTPYYFAAPSMPSGYTYLASLNPTQYTGEGMTSSGEVTYQRDRQQGTVKHLNQLTGKVISSSSYDALTNEVYTNQTDALSGHYIIDKAAVLGRGVSNVSTKADGSQVSWTNTIDNTANGTAANDRDPQEAHIYALPSVQERILTITKPDGTVTRTRQKSTTGTDFPALSGQYTLPGYRAVIDGKPVSDAEAALGIPGEPTDKTHNLKAANDRVPQTHTITYQAEPQKATITYKDVTTGAVLQTDNIQGETDANVPYGTATSIASYLAKGYVLKSNNFRDGAEKFDADSAADQNYLVELVHDSRYQVETKTFKHEVTYTMKGGASAAPQDYVTAAQIAHDYFVDQVTGAKITSHFADYGLNGILNQKPRAPKYTANHPDAQVSQDGQVTFASPLLPQIPGYLPTVSGNTTIHYNKAKDGDSLKSSVLYELDDTINLTIPTDTIFYNTRADVKLRAPDYKITNHSSLPVKVSLDGFVADTGNPALPADFGLNLNVKGHQVTSTRTKLAEKGALVSQTQELLTLANCFNQYLATDTPLAIGSAVNNVANFTYDGVTTTTNLTQVAYRLSLKFESVKF